MSDSIKQAERRGYDGTVARVAGNILAGMARAIVAEVRRTEPQLLPPATAGREE